MANNNYDVKSEIYSFGIVIAEVFSGRLQNRRGVLIDRDTVEDITPDERAGACPEGLAFALQGLSQRCVTAYKKRVDSMAVVMHELRLLVAQFAPDESADEKESAAERLRLREEIALLKAQLSQQRESAGVFLMVGGGGSGGGGEATQDCLICGDPFTRPQGLLCPEISASTGGRHFLCDACFGGGNLDHQLDANYRPHFSQHASQLVCLYCPPLINPFSEQVVAKHLDDAAFGRYRKACNEVVVQIREDELRREFEDRIDIEVERKAAVGASAQRERVARHRLKIAEDILTLKCPSCHAAVFDFNDCFAVTCVCTKYFCGWCLKDVGSESLVAHDHVRRCNHNPKKGELFSSETAFNIHHAKRRQQEVRAYLCGDASSSSSSSSSTSKVQEGDRAAVLEAIRMDLEGLGIDSSNMLAIAADYSSSVSVSTSSVSASGNKVGSKKRAGQRKGTEAEEIVHVFVDISNIDGGRQERKIVPSKLYKAVIKGRQVAQIYAVGSVQNEKEKGSPYWSRWSECDAQLVLLSKTYAGREEAVDEALHAAMLGEASKKYAQRRTMLLLTGDGNDNGGRATSFPHTVENALRGGWLVEVWCFRVSASSVYRRFADGESTRSAFQLFELDSILKQICEGSGADDNKPVAIPVVSKSSSSSNSSSTYSSAFAANKVGGGVGVGVLKGKSGGGKAVAASSASAVRFSWLHFIFRMIFF